jgi:hypothetical protein
MGETIIKREEDGSEAVYESGWFFDTKIGNLRQEFWSGDKVSTNLFGPTVTVSPPGFLSSDRDAIIHTGDEVTEGVFRRGFLEEYPTFRPDANGIARSDSDVDRSYPTGGGESGGRVSAKSASGIGGFVCLTLILSAMSGLYFLGGSVLSRKAGQETPTARKCTLDENVDRLVKSFREDKHIIGKFSDYRMMPVKKVWVPDNSVFGSRNRCEHRIAFVSSRAIYAAYSLDEGNHWISVNGSHPYVKELVSNLREERIREMSKTREQRMAEKQAKVVCDMVIGKSLRYASNPQVGSFFDLIHTVNSLSAKSSKPAQAPRPSRPE